MEKQNNSHTFTPEQVAAVMKPYLAAFTAKDKGYCIRLDHKDNPEKEPTLTLVIGYIGGELYVYLRTPYVDHYVKSMDELDNELESTLSGARKLNEFRKLVRLNVAQE